MDNLKFTKGKTKIVHERCIYMKHLCGDIVGYVNKHTHAPVVGRPEALKVRDNTKDRAVSTLETPQQVISQHMPTVTEGIYIYIYIRNTRWGG